VKSEKAEVVGQFAERREIRGQIAEEKAETAAEITGKIAESSARRSRSGDKAISPRHRS
jgi:hypothetical protein